jgi:hypothetical protein
MSFFPPPQRSDSVYCQGPHRSNKKLYDHLLFVIPPSGVITDEMIYKTGRYCPVCERVLCSCNCTASPNCEERNCDSCHCGCIAYIRKWVHVDEQEQKEREVRQNYTVLQKDSIKQLGEFRDVLLAQKQMQEQQQTQPNPFTTPYYPPHSLLQNGFFSGGAIHTPQFIHPTSLYPVQNSNIANNNNNNNNNNNVVENSKSFLSPLPRSQEQDDTALILSMLNKPSAPIIIDETDSPLEKQQAIEHNQVSKKRPNKTEQLNSNGMATKRVKIHYPVYSRLTIISEEEIETRVKLWCEAKLKEFLHVNIGQLFVRCSRDLSECKFTLETFKDVLDSIILKEECKLTYGFEANVLPFVVEKNEIVTNKGEISMWFAEFYTKYEYLLLDSESESDSKVKPPKPPLLSINVFEAIREIHLKTKMYFSCSPFKILSDPAFSQCMGMFKFTIIENNIFLAFGLTDLEAKAQDEDLENVNMVKNFNIGKVKESGSGIKEFLFKDIPNKKITSKDDNNEKQVVSLDPQDQNEPSSSEGEESSVIEEQDDNFDEKSNNNYRKQVSNRSVKRKPSKKRTNKVKSSASIPSRKNRSNETCAMASVHEVRSFLNSNEKVLPSSMSVTEFEDLFFKATLKGVRNNYSVKISSSKCVLLPALEETKFWFLTGNTSKSNVRKNAKILNRDFYPENQNNESDETENE